MNRSTVLVIAIFLALVPVIAFQSSEGTDNELLKPSQLPGPSAKVVQSNSVFPQVIDYHGIFQQATADSYYQTVKYLSDTIGPRPFGSNANDQARSWISKKLTEYFNAGFSVRTYGEYNSVIGVKNSLDTASTGTFCFSGHFDTVGGSPGADDNGSGTAYFLELARILGQHNVTSTLGFLGCNAEEEGLLGSEEMASYVKTTIGPQIIINADMLLYGEPVLYYLAGYPYETYQYVADLIQSFSMNYGKGYIQTEQTTIYQSSWMYSDQYSFTSRGIPSMVFFESDIDSSPYYHSSLDTADQPQYNYSYGSEVVASVASAIIFLSERADTDNNDYMVFEGTLEPGQSRTYVLQALGRDYVASRLVSDSSMSIKLSGVTGWVKNISYQHLKTGRYELVVRNGDSTSADYKITNTFATDDNGNDIPDLYELDQDGDGITTIDEMRYGTNPYSKDTDNDSLDDQLEIWLGYDPTSNDSDGDLMNDYYEHENGLNPLFPDADDDYDHDGLTNYEESLIGTYPLLSDSDNDGFSDFQEFKAGTDPLNPEEFPSTTSTSATTNNSSSSGANNTPAFEWYTLIIVILPAIWVKKRRFGKKQVPETS
ncbi:MAG: M28 family peptidase [Candidatus Odinarchaeota archaeon]